MALEDDIVFLGKVPTFRVLGREALRILAISAEQRHVRSGEILFDGQSLPRALKDRKPDTLRRIQMIYQMPDTALNPRQTVYEVIGRPLEFYVGLTGAKKEARIAELLKLIEMGLQDISISRQRMPWGIPFPGDEQQTVYVWFDALINYLSATGFPDPGYERLWPADLHVIGKGITRFHCVIWPAMLRAAGLALPRQVWAHGYVQWEGAKMSKTLGNVIDPHHLVNTYGTDATRYLLLVQFPFGVDGDVQEQRFPERYNSDLANDLGNLASRVSNIVAQYCGGEVKAEQSRQADIVKQVQADTEVFKFEQALQKIWSVVVAANKTIDDEKPWALAKTDIIKTTAVLTALVADIRLVASMLAPFMPGTSEKLADHFSAAKIEKMPPLFPRLEAQS